MSNRKPIDKQYLLDSLKNFDREILSKKYSNNSSGAKGEKGDKGDPGEPGKDGITYIPEIGTITTAPSTEAASASVDINEENHTASFNFTIPKGEKGADGNSGTYTEFPDIYTTTDIPAITSTAMAVTDKMLLGTPDGNKKMDQNMLIEFLKGQDLIDLDGKGRPLLPGYGIVTKEVTVTFSNGSTYTDETYPELFGIENSEDIVYIGNYQTDPGTIFITSILIDNAGSKKLRLISNINSYATARVVLFAIYKQKVPYEPGLKTISLTKTLDASGSATSKIFAALSEFGEGLTYKDVVGMVAYNKTKSENVWASVTSGNNAVINNNPVNGNVYEVTLLVKDYSSIGPAIVTDGIRMITKEINFSGNNTPNIALANISDYGVTTDQIVGIQFVSKSSNNQNPKVYLDSTTGDIIANFAANTGGSGLCTLSLFVRVPVVEQKLKPFVKDVTVNLQGTAGSPTGIFLDGSDDVGGYTVDDIGSINVTAITPGKWISPPAITASNEISIAKQPNSIDGPCVVRIKIDPK